MARRNTKLCEMSQRIHRSLTASRSINTTDTQMNAVRNSNNRMIVRGNITAWSPPISSSRTNEHAKELLNPTSVSSWYWNHRYTQNEEVKKEHKNKLHAGNYCTNLGTSVIFIILKNTIFYLRKIFQLISHWLK